MQSKKRIKKLILIRINQLKEQIRYSDEFCDREQETEILHSVKRLLKVLRHK